MIETRRLKNIVIFIQTIFKFWAVEENYKYLQRYCTEIWKSYS